VDVIKLETLIAYLTDHTVIREKKALQKLVYFCAEAGVPLCAKFRLYINGPYSNEVAEELEEVVIKEIVKFSPYGYTYLRGTECDNYLVRDREDINTYREKIQKVLDVFGEMSPLDIELHATIHFIATALNEAYGQVTEEKVVKEVYMAKGDNFSIQRIKSAYHDLLDWGWLRK